MSRIFWDTNLFIYLFEAHPQFSQPTIELRRKMLKRGDQLVTSAMTLGGPGQAKEDRKHR
jgi:hypothetical protein